MSISQHVAVLGATPKADRFANKAIKLLLKHGHTVTPIHPTLSEIEALKVANNVAAINKPIDTLTLYVGPARLEKMMADIIAARPGRVIFNPGTESPLLQNALTKEGIPWQEDCTLVLLNTGRF